MKVFGPNSGLGDHELRRRAKIINYALLYGKQAFTLAKDIGVSREEAQSFIEAYFAGFPSVRAFIDGIVEAGRQTGSVKTMFGRRRLVPDLNNRNGQVRGAAEHADPGIRGRYPEEGDDRRAPRTAADRRRPRPHDPHGARRTAVRGAGAGGRRDRRRRSSGDGIGGHLVGAAHRGRGDREELEGSQELITRGS
jgi:hypothetical protein